ncbi:MAG: ribonuclease HII [Lactobacillales bacterium]|jgi:ribonuclease HII|nr:ribonuclease HII [Lactobacillales bacterium]
MPTFDIEKALMCSGLVFGLDEAGRGPWCGPVVAACVSWPDLAIAADFQKQINDSKKLSAKKRDGLFDWIMQSHAIVGVGQASAQEIDEMNILKATFLAMSRSLADVQKKGHSPAYALIDGNRLPEWPIPCQCVIKGDSLSLSIASASIIAKVTRDRIMHALSREYPQYGWDKNAGYGTADHIAAIKEYGITPHHRKSYKPISSTISYKK